MKAIRVTRHGGPEVLKVEDVPVLQPGPGQVLVRVQAAGVNPVDTYLRSGAYPNASVPYTPGFDAGGTVAELGTGVTQFKQGDRVYTSAAISGTYAEFALCAADTLHPLPAAISFAQGAALGIPYATAYAGLFLRADAKPGESLLIHGGSGGVGTAAIQFARAAGLVVIATSGTEQGRKLVIENGAHHALDHSAPGYLDKLMQLTGNRGVDVVLEMLANVNLGKDLTVLAKFGRVVVIGSRGNVEINPRDTMARNASVLGMTLFNFSPGQLRPVHAAIYAGLENGVLRPVVGREFPLEDAAKAHEAVMAPGARGKIVLMPWA